MDDFKVHVLGIAIISSLRALVEKYDLPEKEATDLFMERFGGLIGASMGKTYEELQQETKGKA